MKAEDKEHINVIFLGHVDAGKSTIAGRVVYATGGVDERTVAKYEKEATDKNRGTWFLAYIMDLNDEERDKGKTVEVGRATFQTDTRRVTILDAPGHKNYVPNMIGGAAQADIGLLVISARKGEFETGFEKGGQTREHAMLARTLGVSKLIVIVNKMDEKTVKWSKDRFDGIVKKLKSFLKQAGYGKDTSFIPVSGYTGANIMEPAGDDCPWYTGKTLIGAIDNIEPPVRSAEGALRLPILGKYKEGGRTYILGKVEQGTLTEGQKILILPSKEKGTVSEIGTDECLLKVARPGENVRITTSSSLNTENVHEGFVICEPDRPVKLVNKFEAEMIITDLLPHKPIFSAGYLAVMHIHTCVSEVTVDSLIATIDKKKGLVIQKKPKFVRRGDYVRVRFTTEHSLGLDTFDELPQLGRFTLRDESKTIAMGKITRLPKSLYSE